MLHALLSAACSFKLPALDLKLPSPSLAEDGRFGGGGYATALRVCADVLSSPNDSGGWRELGTLLHGNRSDPTGIFVYGRQPKAAVMELRKRFFGRLRQLRDAPRDRGRPVLYLLNVNARGATLSQKRGD